MVDLLVEQIEFANVIIINKVDLVNQEELQIVKSIIRSLNAKAKIIDSTMSQVDLAQVMNTGRFNLEEAQDHPLWAQELNNHKEHIPETEEYGITSFVYRAREPFIPEKIHAFFYQEWPGVVRSKGFFWISTRPEFVGELSQAGPLVRHQGMGRWWSAVPKERWPDDEDFKRLVNEDWDDQFGDRRQEIVFIGLKAQMNEQKIRQQLDACLIKGYINDPKKYVKLKDPFPAWFAE